MKKFLIVVDMQKDFIDGPLGTLEAELTVKKVCQKINAFDGEIIATLDTHFDNYLSTAEGKKLPVPHCIKGTLGWELDARVKASLEHKSYTAVEKHTFGSVDLPGIIKEKAEDEEFTVELIGVCTDICVISNALIIKANFPECEISVDADCCAGVSPDTHFAALKAMSCCQINVENCGGMTYV